MNTSLAVRTTRFLKTSLAFVSAALPLATASPARGVTQGPYSLELLVDEQPLAELHGNGRSYVEALAGREYTLRLTNNTDCRVGIAVAVDGLNSIDARTTTAKSGSKWILGPHESITLDGWQTSSELARRFYFTSEKRSYGAWLGKTDNLGLVAAVVFREHDCEARRPMLYQEERGAPTHRGRSDAGGMAGAAPPPPSAAAPAAPGGEESPAESSAAPKQLEARPSDDYAATGIGRELEHPVQRVQFRAERSAAATLEIRYEYRPALVRLGLLPRAYPLDPLQRRERAHGFEPGFAPDPYRPNEKPD
jgi:hypothetical protein